LPFGFEELLAYTDLPFAAALVLILWKIINNHYKHIQEQSQEQTKTLAVISQTLIDHSTADTKVFSEIYQQSRLTTEALAKLNDNIIRIEERTR